MSKEHDPPTMINLRPGIHTWKCPNCGQETTFEVVNPICIDKSTTFKRY